MTDLWMRLEPLTRGESLLPGLQAKVFDPLWLLGRQWMIGEFDGEDAGTPVGATADLGLARMTGIQASRVSTALDVGAAPLDLAEAQPVRSVPNLRERIELWRAFDSFIADASLSSLMPGLLAAFPLPSPDEDERRDDPEAAALYDLLVGRLGDGMALRNSIAAGGPKDLVIVAKAAVVDWLAWVQASLAEPGASTWRADRLSYDFDIAGAGLAQPLRVAGHDGDGLHWADFDFTGSPPASAAETVTIKGTPTAIRFGGMPNARYWEFEDQVIDLGAVDAPVVELARAALVQFAFLYGNDAFSMPVQTPQGVAATVSRLEVLDTFGDVIGPISIPSALRQGGAIGQGWALWAADHDGSPTPWSVFPHAALDPLRGERLAEVMLLRDEMANLVWSVETARLCGDGRSRPPTAQPGGDFATPPPAGDALQYRLSSQPPDGWSAFELEIDSGGQRWLHLLDGVTGSGRLVTTGARIHEEEIGREGVRLVLEDVYSRSIDGGTVVWRRIRRGVGRGGGSSGLRFDFTQVSQE